MTLAFNCHVPQRARGAVPLLPPACLCMQWTLVVMWKPGAVCCGRYVARPHESVPAGLGAASHSVRMPDVPTRHAGVQS